MNTSDKWKLKPCPFCGKAVAEVTTAADLEECKYFDSQESCSQFKYLINPTACHAKVIVCNYIRGGCGASTRSFPTYKEAVEAWNNRVSASDDDLR